MQTNITIETTAAQPEKTELIRLAGDKPGIPPHDRVPVEGRWYVGMEFIGDGCERAGILMRFDGEGCWSSGEPDEETQPDPSDYDYLQEQR